MGRAINYLNFGKEELLFLVLIAEKAHFSSTIFHQNDHLTTKRQKQRSEERRSLYHFEHTKYKNALRFDCESENYTSIKKEELSITKYSWQ